MHAFVDMMKFSDLSFVDALRSFLQHFRLPGEAQKIDRFMLKFAERYCIDNPNHFSSADTAYVLAYSVIMLNTDLHNPQVKKKMTKGDFLKNNRGIDDGKDIPASFLEGIFDEIAVNEIKMKDEQQPSQKTVEYTTVTKKGSSAKDHDSGKPSETIQVSLKKHSGSTRDPASMDARITNVSGKSVFYLATQIEHIKPMFQLIWMSCLMSLSSFLQKSDDLDTIITALEGFQISHRICCIFDLELERKGFISNLSKFITLESIHDIKMRNVESAKMLLQIAYADGNYLDSYWPTVINLISQIDKLIQAGSPENDKTLDPKRKDAVIQVFDALSSQSITLLIDRIFSQSGRLSGSAIVKFVSALCELSWDEILMSSELGNPRMYSLQRLVEISYYNMKRIRVEWSQIWQVLGPHLNQVTGHQNSNIGFFALDKLRQMSMKFLDIEELANFKFQKEFLKPFEYALSEQTPLKIKDMSLTCLHQMIQSKAGKLKSGWKTIFSALHLAAQEKEGIRFSC